VTVSGFSIQQHEVTNQEYARFDPAHQFPGGQDLHPVAGVSWYEAAAYAAWLGAGLPTEAQWEYAAAGTSGRKYPWGTPEPTAEHAVFGQPLTGGTGTRPVSPARAKGETPEGLQDMAGNVWEWCLDWYGAYSPENAVDALGPTALHATTLGDSRLRLRVLRGGSFVNTEFNLRTASRLRHDPELRLDFVGFRLVSSRLRP
jgi:formylglycine-generating enzyme required for sulfatase activity